MLGGGRDIALVLLPLLNDLRAARGQPLLSEGTLLLLNLSPQSKERSAAPHKGSGEDPVLVARKLRPKFQLALLGWIQGGDTKSHLETLSGVIAALESSANRDDMFQLWWVVGGVLESLQNGGLETSVALKRLLPYRYSLLVAASTPLFVTNVYLGQTGIWLAAPVSTMLQPGISVMPSSTRR